MVRWPVNPAEAEQVRSIFGDKPNLHHQNGFYFERKQLPRIDVAQQWKPTCESLRDAQRVSDAGRETAFYRARTDARATCYSHDLERAAEMKSNDFHGARHSF